MIIESYCITVVFRMMTPYKSSLNVPYSIIIADEKKLEAVMEIVLVVCSGCSSHGTCNYTNIREVSDEDENYRFATCHCEPYWEGRSMSAMSHTVRRKRAFNSVLLIEPRYEKPNFCICENKDADQLRGNREADQRLCFRYTNSTIPLLS